MKRLLFILIAIITVGQASADIKETITGEEIRLTATDGDPDQIAERSNNVKQEPTDKLIRVYSMNSIIFVETNDGALITVSSLSGKYNEERRAVGTLTAFPVSRGDYIVKVGDSSQKIRVK